MLPDRVSNPGPLTYESGALPMALRGPALRNNANRIINKREIKWMRQMSEAIRDQAKRLNEGEVSAFFHPCLCIFTFKLLPQLRTGRSWILQGDLFLPCLPLA